MTSRSISALLDLQSRYSNFSLKINHIAGQLSTIKTALEKIKYLVEVSHDDILQRNEARFVALEDSQLVIRLGLSVDDWYADDLCSDPDLSG
ncbi:hypothetical protein TCE0_044f16009 [Talaromyces pinophilus]|uniref:Uncharacterized protein n=1 Tax=Talaromyces pinophilus TaxID=128442 RepID=A0A478EB84_TALPI|nr:hypothetical protein TCE0_044f16009 [Talaromyces pinophilus]